MKILKNLGMSLLVVVAFYVYYGIESIGLGYAVSGVPELAVTLVELLLMAGIIFVFWKWYQNKFTFLVKESLLTRYIWLPLVFLGLFLLGQHLIPVSSSNQDELIKVIKQMPLLMGLFTVFVAPIVEEFIFRGFLAKYIFPKQDSYWKMIAYTLVSSTIFSLIHTPDSIPSFLVYFIMGVVYCSAYLARGDIRYAILLHILNNAIAYVEILRFIYR